MGRIASEYCEKIIITNDDPYDEDPLKIAHDVKSGVVGEAEIIIDRREAIHKALSLADTGDTVIISGKGTDPYLMEAGGKKTPWDDASVTKEELQKIRR